MPRALLARSAGTRALDFVHTHTGERLAVEYFGGGTYVPDALADVNHFLRDFRTGDVHTIDPSLLAEGIGVITIPDLRWARPDIKSVALLPNALGCDAVTQQREQLFAHELERAPRARAFEEADGPRRRRT